MYFDIEVCFRARLVHDPVSLYTQCPALMQLIFLRFQVDISSRHFNHCRFVPNFALCSHGQFNLKGHAARVTQHMTMEYVQTCWFASTGRIGLGHIGQYARARDCMRPLKPQGRHPPLGTRLKCKQIRSKA
jgi:hypothetical protein